MSDNRSFDHLIDRLPILGCFIFPFATGKTRFVQYNIAKDKVYNGSFFDESFCYVKTLLSTMPHKNQLLSKNGGNEEKTTESIYDCIDQSICRIGRGDAEMTDHCASTNLPQLQIWRPVHTVRQRLRPWLVQVMGCTALKRVITWCDSDNDFISEWVAWNINETVHTKKTILNRPNHTYLWRLHFFNISKIVSILSCGAAHTLRSKDQKGRWQKCRRWLVVWTDLYYPCRTLWMGLKRTKDPDPPLYSESEWNNRIGQVSLHYTLINTRLKWWLRPMPRCRVRLFSEE